MDTHGWRSLQERRLESRLTMWYKTLHGVAACSIPPCYSQKENSASTRDSHNQQFTYPTATIDCYKYSFFQRTIKTWNLLPAHIVVRPVIRDSDTTKYAHSINAFKDSLHQQFLNGRMHVVAPRGTYNLPRLDSTRCATTVDSVY